MANDLIKWNVRELDQEDDQEIDDSMIPADPPGYVPQREPETPELDIEAVGGYPEEALQDEEAEEINDAEILSNARLRLEQGRLYEMLMTSDIFNNLDADAQAVKNVQREMKRFAKERMEVMLGMKKPVEQQVNVAYAQFNSLEVDVLKSLAKKLSGGASADTGPQPAPKSKTLSPITNNSTKTTKLTPKETLKAKPVPQKAPVKSASRGPVEELTPDKPIEEMTYDEKLAYNTKKASVYESRKATNPDAIPMPSIESLNAINSKGSSIKGGAISTGFGSLDRIASSMLKR